MAKIGGMTPNIQMNAQRATHTRSTVDTSFGNKLKQGLSATASAVGGVASIATASLGNSGGTIVSAALAGAKGIGSSSSALTANAANTAGGSLASNPTGGGTSLHSGPLAEAGGTTSGVQKSGGFSDAKALLEKSTANNVRFLALQNEMQTESRNFQTISNALKNRHQSASNSIRNIN